MENIIIAPEPGTEMGSWDKEKIVNSQDQQIPLNIADQEEIDTVITNEGETDNWTKKDPEEDPGENPGNDTDDSEETKKKIPEA